MTRPVDDRPRPPEARRRDTPRRALVVLLVLAGLVVLGVELWQEAYSVDRAGPGDCLSQVPSSYRSQPPRYERAACDRSAEFVVRDLRATPKDCVEVPGAVRAFAISETVLCIGRPRADPDRAINDVQAGECIAGTGGELPEKAPCGGLQNWRVLQVLRDVDAVDVDLVEEAIPLRNDLCAAAPGTEQVYAWGFSQYGGSLPRRPDDPRAAGTWDRVLCLGR